MNDTPQPQPSNVLDLLTATAQLLYSNNARYEHFERYEDHFRAIRYHYIECRDKAERAALKASKRGAK